MLKNRFTRNITLITIIAVYFLILVGGIVRSMGAGMGCPDWPKCFDQYVPPTTDSGLPENYEELYVQSRLEKNARLAKTLSGLGFNKLSARVVADPGIREVTFFDAQKAWVEYINRLIGVIIGFLILINMVASFSYRKENRLIPILGVLCLVLVLFQGWIGSLVVSTNLLPGFISVHMILALMLVCLLIWQYFLITNRKIQRVSGRNLILILLVMFAAQIILGVQVREQVDILKVNSLLPRNEWVSALGTTFYIHRSYSLLLTGLIGYVVFINYRKGRLNLPMALLIGVVVVEIILGAVMAYFAIPAAVQPVHLLLGTLAFGLIFYLFLASGKLKQTI